MTENVRIKHVENGEVVTRTISKRALNARLNASWAQILDLFIARRCLVTMNPADYITKADFVAHLSQFAIEIKWLLGVPNKQFVTSRAEKIGYWDALKMVGGERVPAYRGIKLGVPAP
jgi:hypothetical protein